MYFKMNNKQLKPRQSKHFYKNIYISIFLFSPAEWKLKLINTCFVIVLYDEEPFIEPYNSIMYVQRTCRKIFMRKHIIPEEFSRV